MGRIAGVLGEMIDLDGAVVANRLEGAQDAEHVHVTVVQPYLFVAAGGRDSAADVAEVDVEDLALTAEVVDVENP